MAAIIKIDQAGLPAGVNDRSRSDGLATGAIVTLTSVTPGSTNAWALLWVPDADVAAEASLTPSGATATFTPTVGARGTYRIRLTVDAGLPTESISIRTFAVKTANALLRIPALNERADPASSLINDGAAYIATSENNENGAGPFSAGNYGGYYTAMKELIEYVDGLKVGIVARRTVTGPTSVTVLATDHLIQVDTTAGAVTLTLPDPATTDRIYEIKDIAGTFGTNACTLARFAGGDQIEGLAANYLLEANWQIQRIGSNGATKWWLL